MTKITAKIYQQAINQYVLVSGFTPGAPTCPYGNHYQWVGYDLLNKKYVRFTKSVYKKLIQKVKHSST